MTDKRTERLANAMELFLAEVRNQIIEEVDKRMGEEPYEEVDGDDGLPESAVPLSRSTVRDYVIEEFVGSGEDVSNVDCYNFFEWVADEIFGTGIRKKNPYGKEGENSKDLVSEWEPEPLRLEVGKRYKTRDERIAFVQGIVGGTNDYFYGVIAGETSNLRNTWFASGKVHENCEFNYDLVECLDD